MMTGNPAAFKAPISNQDKSAKHIRRCPEPIQTYGSKLELFTPYGSQAACLVGSMNLGNPHRSQPGQMQLQARPDKALEIWTGSPVSAAWATKRLPSAVQLINSPSVVRCIVVPVRGTAMIRDLAAPGKHLP